jgi:uncharacterized UBP type Zn finger protein
MFGLRNFKGSCWVNTALQALYRIPEVQQRYDALDFEGENPIDECLCKIWKSKGEDGLKDFFQVVKTVTMPAGDNIGDSHELFQYLCDKLPFLDKLCRFKVADEIRCNICSYKEVKEDSVIEYSIISETKDCPITTCISKSVEAYEIPSWKCDKCNNFGCKKRQLIGSFPKVMFFHLINTDSSVEYSSILSLNKQNYALLYVGCYDGFHWWGYGRNMPPGSSWYSLNDTQVSEHGPKQFPLSRKMRLLIYYRLED